MRIRGRATPIAANNTLGPPTTTLPGGPPPTTARRTAAQTARAARTKPQRALNTDAARITAGKTTAPPPTWLPSMPRWAASKGKIVSQHQWVRAAKSSVWERNSAA
jgi:hypothetical protein